MNYNQYDVTVTNKSGVTLPDYIITVTANSIRSFWTAKLVSVQGSTYKFSSPDWIVTDGFTPNESYNWGCIVAGPTQFV